MVTVLITGGGTGGHLMPALALAETLRGLAPEIEPVLVGAERGVEAKILPQRGICRFHLLPSRPIYRTRVWRNLPWIWWAPKVYLLARKIVRQERPTFVVGTGGYASGPILLAAKLNGIPFALQEQNAVPGITTRLLAGSARQIHLGFPGAKAWLRPGKNTQIHAFGNPVAIGGISETDRIEARRTLGLDGEARVLFVMGGSQGALAINRAVSDAIEAGLFGGLNILWSVGGGMWEQYARYDSLPHVIAKPFWDPVSLAYAAADLVVARAGAMTTAELAAAGLPSILIPLPSAAADHQTENAKAMESVGAAVHLQQSELGAAALARAAQAILSDPTRLKKMSEGAKNLARPNAARDISEALLKLLH